MSDTISNLTFQKTWMSRNDFPTYEGDEDKVRGDLQYFPERIREYINDTLVATINSMLADISQLVAGTVTDDSVYTDAIQSAAVTLAKMAQDSVGTDQLVDDCITTDKYAPGSVDQDALDSDSVNTSKLVDNAVTSAKIANSNVTAEKLGSDILPVSVGFVVGTGDPTQNPSLISNGQVYLKIEN